MQFIDAIKEPTFICAALCYISFKVGYHFGVLKVVTEYFETHQKEQGE